MEILDNTITIVIYTFYDLAIEKCYCENPNLSTISTGTNGILCDTTDSSSRLFGSCDSGQVCLGNYTDDYANRKVILCRKGRTNFSRIYLCFKLNVYIKI